MDGPSVIALFNTPATPVFALDYLANRAAVSVVVSPANTHRIELEPFTLNDRNAIAVFATRPVS